LKKKKLNKKSIKRNKKDFNFPSTIFDQIKQKLLNRNINKPYPDINDIPK